MNTWLMAAAWLGVALAAGLGSVGLGVSVSLVEIAAGFAAGNFLGLHTAPWIDFLAGLGSVLLTFLAGADIDPGVLRSKLKESLSIGLLSFLLPFLAAFLYTYYAAGWNLRAAELAGVALSTTSVAVVYAVMVETGLNSTELGKVILAACFITDLGTVLALGLFFATFNKWMFLFVAVAAGALDLLPKGGRWFFRVFGGKVSELEIKFILVTLFGLGGLASMSNSEAVLPAYLVGLALAGTLLERRELMQRLRSATFALLTPFYFIKAGLFVTTGGLIAGVALIGVLLLVKMASKFVGVWPLTTAYHFGPRNGMYTTLLMSTGLTFGTISSMFGLTHGIITQGQYSVLVTVVILSAIVPTLIAQTYFRPALHQASLPVGRLGGATADPKEAENKPAGVVTSGVREAKTEAGGR